VFARQSKARKADFTGKVVRFFQQNVLGERPLVYFPHYEFRPIARSVFNGPDQRVSQPDPLMNLARFQVAAPAPAPVQSAPPLPTPIIVSKPKPMPLPVKPIVAARAAAVDDVPLTERITAMDWQRCQQRLVTQVNAQQPPGCHVMAYSILPIDLFVGEVGRFLMMACAFYAYAPFNTMLLPATPAGAAQLQLPQHPHVISTLQHTDAKTKILQLRTRVANEHHRVAVAIERGDVSELFKQKGNRVDYKTELAEICKSVAINAFGLSAYSKHDRHFGALLKAAKISDVPQLSLNN
jgi:hypothetical protein